MSTKTLNEDDLAYFTGTTQWYRHPLVRSVLYTDGVQYVAQAGGADGDTTPFLWRDRADWLSGVVRSGLAASRASGGGVGKGKRPS
jgi:hypothetical protein